VQPKIVYGNNISQAKQLASSGNADTALTAYSLVFRESGAVIPVDGKLHRPLDQALGILTTSAKQRQAAQFTAFVLGPEGRSILSRCGYRFP
jgi:molybdate transport system substrate-binding protein